MAKVQRLWTAEEVAQLDIFSQRYTTAEIARKLGRTKSSVRGKANREKLELLLTVDRISAQKLAQYLGVNRRTVTYWISKGLKARLSKGQGKGKHGKARHTYRIKLKDFAEFYRANRDGSLWSLRKIPPEVVKWICGDF
jgi:DNA-binding CsgD family transcriptional regulator